MYRKTKIKVWKEKEERTVSDKLRENNKLRVDDKASFLSAIKYRLKEMEIAQPIK